MSRRKNPSSSQVPQPPIQLLVAKLGLTGTILAAIIGALGISIAAYFSYLAVMAQINATSKSSVLSSPTIASGSNLPNYGDLLFNEDFEDRKANGLFIVSGPWHVTTDADGNSAFEVAAGSDWAYANLGPVRVANATLEYRIKIKSESAQGPRQLASVEFRRNEDPNILYLFAIDLNSNDGYLAYQGTDWAWRVLEGASTSVRWQKDTWYTIRIQMLRDRLTVYLNGDPFTSAQDGRVDQGTVNFGMGPGMDVELDDIRVWRSNP